MKSIKVTDHSISQEEFVLEYNSDLELYKTNPVPKDLSKYYESENYISHTDAAASVIDKLYQKVKKRTLKGKEKLVSRLVNVNNKSILDIGSGTGSFLEVLNKNGWHSIGIEPNEKARDISRDKNAIAFETLNEIQNHDACFYKSFWAAYDVPRHIWHFSETSIKKIAEKHNFELIESKPMWFDSFYVSLLSEKYRKNKVNYFRAFLVGLLSNLKALINSQFSSKTYILKAKTQNKAI